jgi:hypothetical protein
MEKPQRTLIDGRADLAQALETILSRATHFVRVMDHDLAPLDVSAAGHVHKLESLLLAHRAARVRLLVDDVRWLDTQASRLRQLQRDFSHALELRVANEADPVGDTSCVLGDSRDALLLKNTVYAQGELWLDHEPHAQPWVSEFDRRWEHAGHNLPVAPLGL